MPKFIITEYDTIVSEYRIEAKDRDTAIDKIANGDIVKRGIHRSKSILKDKTRRWYKAEEIKYEKEKVQVICLPTEG